MNPAPSPLALRPMTPADLPFADSVRAAVGWNQTLDDWRRFLAMEPDGCFVAEWEGAPVGTATTTIYGEDLGWIGMVLVHPDFRRRGIGRALLVRCIEHLHARGVRCIKLDATPAGKLVYDGLGFKDEWVLSRWDRSALQPASTVPDPGLRPWREADAAQIHWFDDAVLGVPRRRLVETLARQSRTALVAESPPGRIAGYGLLRAGSRAVYLGPIAAASEELGLRLIAALAATIRGENVFWDIPDQNLAAVAWARQQGFRLQRSLIRMYLGPRNVPSDPRKTFALAGPEVG